MSRTLYSAWAAQRKTQRGALAGQTSAGAAPPKPERWSIMVSVRYLRKHPIVSVGLTAAAAVLLLLSLATSWARAGPSNTHLAEWGATYEFWAFGDPDDAGVTFSNDAYGNTAVGS